VEGPEEIVLGGQAGSPRALRIHRLIAPLANLVPRKLKLRLIGKPQAPTRFATWVHSVLNLLPVESFPVLPCQGALSGFRMKINWQDHRSFVHGTWEPEVVNAVEKVVRPGMTTLDVGAYSGFYTLLLSKLAGRDGRIISFEPLPANFRLLQENIALNQCRNILAVNKALGDRTEQMEMTVRGSESALMRRRTPEAGGAATMNVPVVSIDDFLMDANLAVDFIKMDAEGAEGLILEGARNTIARCHPTLVVELHYFEFDRENHPAIRQLAAWDYEVEWLNIGGCTAHILARWKKPS
jgi:FkbM family methyltransferase